MTPPRITRHVLAVVKVLLDDPPGAHYGLDVARQAGLKVTSVYAVLLRLEGAGWLTSHWEELDPGEAGRPRRRLYRLTNLGTVQARDALREAQQQLGAVPEAKPGWVT